MNASTVAVDLAKSLFQLAVTDHAWRVVETHRLTRAQFARWFDNLSIELFVMKVGNHHDTRTRRTR